jgi:putative restriction endonuclease
MSIVLEEISTTANLYRRVIDAAIVAIEDSGCSAILLSKRSQCHPREVLVTAQSGKYDLLWIYIWHLMIGAGPSLCDEYQMKMTMAESPLRLNPHGPTVLMGYEPILNVFAGFDIGIQRELALASSMASIDVETVRQSLQNGLSFHRKNNREVAIGVRPDQFMNYVHHAMQLHKLGRQAATEVDPVV